MPTYTTTYRSFKDTGEPNTVPCYDENGKLVIKVLDSLGGSGNLITSNPPEGHVRVTNIYVNAVTGKTVVDYDDTGTIGEGSIVSAPPIGHYKVVNIYVNPNTNRTVVDYDNTPQP